MMRIGTALLALVLASQARGAFVIDGVAYSANGVSESLTAAFTTPDAAVTSNLYSGFVEVSVSGVGFSYGPARNDAFYTYINENGVPITPTNDYVNPGFFQLGFDTKALVLSDSARAAKKFLVYDVQAGAQVAPGYVPAYRSDHSYDFVLKVDSSTASRLHFGVVDYVFNDNGGAYSLRVTQLAPSSVPEPSSMLMLSSGLCATLIYLRRRAM